ncbi:D-alanyl-D-alanine carboxypeptidase, partial [bacterium]|nr:D-alanyl-D-alanine carboxypeptidase [bacterium]
NKLKIEHNTEISSNILNVSGSVSKTNIINIPVPSPKKYFKMRLEDAIRAKKIEYYSPIVSAKLPDKNVYLVHSVVHDVSQIMEDILKNSCNLSAESLVKAAGAFLAGSQGNFENSSEMINGYLEKLAIPHDDIRIVDGSGVSKNNLMTSDFMTSFLTAQIKVCPEYLEFMASPGEGTLKNRMLYFKDNLKAKTGTLSDTSAIAGYITSRKGKVYAFDIMIKDAKTSSADKKNIEEQILRHIYTNY